MACGLRERGEATRDATTDANDGDDYFLKPARSEAKLVFALGLGRNVLPVIERIGAYVQQWFWSTCTTLSNSRAHSERRGGDIVADRFVHFVRSLVRSSSTQYDSSRVVAREATPHSVARAAPDTGFVTTTTTTTTRD